MSIHQSRPFIVWLKGVLVAGGVAVEIMKKPATVPAGAGYAVIYPRAGGTTEGTLDDPHEDASPNVQITSFSSDEDQALWLADRIRTLIVAAVPATLTDSRRVIWLEFATAGPTGTRDDRVEPSIFMVPDVIEFGTTT